MIIDERPINVRTELQHFNEVLLKKIQNGLSKNFSILLFNVRTGGNIAMSIRTACLLGCKEVIICGRKQYDKRFTTGSHNYIKVTYWSTPLKVNINCISPNETEEIIEYNPIEFAKMCGDRTPIFIEQGGKDIRTISWKLLENPLLIVGNETSGIPYDFIKTVKKLIPETIIISIPQFSVMRSLNVSVAASIAMWEIAKEIY
jgi:tRNA G18 (ribose-2'-O)-methylase SpoU